MKILPLGHISSVESNASQGDSLDVEAASDADVIAYFEEVERTYRRVIERFFEPMAEHLPFYKSHPYRTTLIRSGNSGVICLWTPSNASEINVRKWGDWPVPLSTLFEIRDYFDAPFCSFDFRPRVFRITDAALEGAREALKDAVELFWHLIDAESFADLCVDLVEAEGIRVIKPSGESLAGGARGTVLLAELAGFRREEEWMFEFHHHPTSRVSAQLIREAATKAEKGQSDVICLITSGDLTSIGNYVSVDSANVRVWDGMVLYHLMNRHLDVVAKHFQGYTEALSALDEEFRKSGGKEYERARRLLEQCPTGQQHYEIYEKLGIELFSSLFSGSLGPARAQSSTEDGVHRRDVVFRNLQASSFFKRVADRFGADFLIVDFKNYERAVSGAILESAAKYANKALGKLILVVSRKGGGSSARRAQLRLFRDDDVVVLPISDDHLLEMIARKEKGELPEDVIEDLLDELLVSY